MPKTNNEKAIEFSKLGYTVEMLRDKATDGSYIYLARNPELDGCMAQGETPEEALEYLDEVRIEYLEHLLEHNLPIPYPIVTSSGGSVSIEELPAVTFEGFEEVLTNIVQPAGREILYSVTSSK
jgi:predicted RNase H-like HicB family nuclease